MGSGDETDGNRGNGDEPDDGRADERSTVDTAGTLLGDITVDNLDQSAHTIDVIVEFDRTIEAWATEALEAGGGTTLERNWPSEPGQFRVTVRVDQSEPVEVTPADWNEPSCLNLFVRIDRDGALTVLSDTSSGPGSADDGSSDDTSA
ncbi:hypothetical protein ACFR99_17535 [Haloarchaeobius amylolyticus]|uniref:Uncharacterized protein n=1 Tax=Haloarchaeobius amylolyticus TaxID=1198296 RepID=A0ABD6BK79_9EURY